MSAQANNPSQLDLYVEKIVSYMNLDDAQRLDVVREIRDHLEQSIATAQMRGIPQDRAEKEAIQKFGNPHTLAGNFGTNGTIWMAFEAIAYAIAVFVLYWFGFSRVPDWPFVSLTTTTALAAIIAFFAVAARLWNRVQVNGQLKIYRFLRPTLHIPFENISEVRLDRFHLFGPKRVHLSFGNQHTNYSASWLNARCVGIALEVLVPQAIHPKAAIYFRRLRLNNGQEPLTLKLLVTIGWLALAGLLALTFQPLWNNEGISIWFGIVLIGVILSAWIQYAIHASRLKRTVSLLLASILTVFIPIVIANSILTPDGFRALVLFVALLLPVPLLMLWVPDRNRSRSLVIFAVWIVLALFAYYRTPKETLITNGYLFTSPGLVNNATWLSTPQNKNAVWLQ